MDHPETVSNKPLYTLISVALLVGFGLAGAVIADNQRALELLIGLIVTTVPSLIAAGYAERTSRDIRNGVIQRKIVGALDHAGVNAENVDTIAQGMTQLVATDNATENNDSVTDDETPVTG